MPCASVRISCALLLCLGVLTTAISTGAAEYQSVTRPEITRRPRAIPEPRRNPEPRSEKPANGVKIPKFGNSAKSGAGTPAVSEGQAKKKRDESKSGSPPVVEARPGKKREEGKKRDEGKSAPPAALEGQADKKRDEGKSGESGARGAPIKLFGTVEFRRPLTSLPGWLDVLRRNDKEPIFFPDNHLRKNTTWGDLRERARQLKPLEQLRLVNSFWNSWKYREDPANWGKPDYWAIPAQFIKKSGDCEDYAIAKYFTLKELGFDPASMRIVVVRDTFRNLAHAVLAVYLNGDAYILDNVSNVVLSHRRVGNYSPQFSVNEFGRWTHIKGKPAK